MRKILVTGGTVFVSRYVAEYYVNKGDKVYVLNRNHNLQPEGVTLIEGDRNHLGDILLSFHFDVILDITAYTAKDIVSLLDAVGGFEQYIMVSSSAVYPENLPQPFSEEMTLGENKFWGNYGTNKIEAEIELMKRVPEAYILRPPYLYGPGNNVYREAFVFSCALQNRKFYLPKDGAMKLQFFYVGDLCRFLDAILENKPGQHIFNVGNEDAVSVKDWVTRCYEAAGKEAQFVPVVEECEQRNYFSFYDYEYKLDVRKQQAWMKATKPLKEGLAEAFSWYVKNRDKVIEKPYLEYIEKHFEA